MMVQNDWFTENQLAIERRLSWLINKPKGVIYKKSSALHEVIIQKRGSHIRLIFVDPTAEEIMSRMDINEPLYLLAPYTQAMMLSLLWVEEPSLVYVAGFGGGRIPMILHHFFPEVIVESTEVDKDVIEIAKKYFGVALDSRIKVFIQDGREYLTQQTSQVDYDIIMLDAFRGTGYGPYQFSTKEFYDLCRNHLKDNGVVVVNLLPGDSLYYHKMKTLASSFVNSYFVRVGGTDILFASNGKRFDKIELIRRAELIQARHQFSFPFVEHAANLKSITESDNFTQHLQNAHELTDMSPPLDYFESISTDSTIFKKSGRNDPCPCGSGKKFKNCHGRKNQTTSGGNLSLDNKNHR